MNRKKYRITIKMTKTTIMEHEQVNMKQAKEDIKKLLENASNEVLEETFDSKPKFTYKIEIV